jgi:hypothetical protein
MIKRLRRPRVGLLAIALSIGGCSAAPHVVAPAKPAARPPALAGNALTSSAPTGAALPSTPADTAEAVKAVALQYFAAADQALRSGDTTGILRVSVPSCGCRQMARYATAIHREGRVIGASVTFTTALVLRVIPDEADVQLTAKFAPLRVIDASGRLVEHSSLETFTYIVEMRPFRGHWLVSRVDRV